ncbi:hypothetical protein JYJ95_37975 [Corallococcus exiguus]|uniref:phage baseplate protein n=1 Tax=Corallococcus exiguus TaxID=83462 RepID=UPI001471F26C|nr:hypothetical protein [Corallococcus exiguus]MBN8472326.1 hypothetical protein [Corallococcus exiguus]NNB91485.1 hypothetical protein [Corallococcus exiguus]
MARPVLFRYSPTGERILTLEADAILEANVVEEAQPTDNPVELGADVTDHMVLRPQTWEVRIAISDTPVDGPAEPGRARSAREQLGRLLEARGKLVLALPIGEREPVVLTRFSTAFTTSTPHCEVLSLTLREIHTANSFVVPVFRSEHKAMGVLNRGKLVVKEVGPELKKKTEDKLREQERSFAINIGAALSNSFK